MTFLNTKFKKVKQQIVFKFTAFELLQLFYISYLLLRLWILTEVIITHDALDTKDMVEARRKMKICLRTYHFFDAKSPSIPAPT